VNPRSVRHAAAWLAAVATVTGCAGLEGSRLPDLRARVIARAYGDGVRDGAARLVANREAELGDPWVPPLVQEVWMPARVVEGVLIPAHHEWVVIHPAQWRRSPRSGADASLPAPRPGEWRRP
jgi:hypothetical protein